MLHPTHTPRLTHAFARGLRSLTTCCRAVFLGGLARSHVAAQGLVEYALVLVLIAIVVIGVLTVLGRQTSQVFMQVNCTLGGATMHTDNGNGNSNRCR